MALFLNSQGHEVPNLEADVQVHRDDRGRFWVRIGHRNHSVSVHPLGGGQWDVRVDGIADRWKAMGLREILMERMGLEDVSASRARELRAPMPGKVLEILVEEGQEVEEGEAMIVLEAMKMENVLRAGSSGTVSSIGVETGNAVEKEAVLICMEN